MPFEIYATGEAALARISEGARYAILLADYQLAATMNGLELVAAVTEKHPSPAPPAVLITGDFDPDLISSAHAQKLPLLHKPLRPNALRNLLGVPGSPAGEPPLADRIR